MRLRRFVFLLLAMTAGSVVAQNYHITSRCSQPVRGGILLVVYDGDSTFSQYRTTVQNSTFQFEGSVKRPTLAELRTRAGESLFFYLENAEIRIEYNTSDPAASRITGSRSNSQFRYLLENCNKDPQCLKEHIRNNPGEIFAPFLITDYIWNDNDAELLELYNALQDDATRTYHYHLLRHRLERLAAVTVGQLMPNFVYYDSVPHHFDSLRTQHPEWNGKKLALLIGATWCEQCQRILQQLQVLCADSSIANQLAYFAIDIDRSNKGWETPFMEQLSIPMIPYLILLDADNRIIARDIRIWELEKQLKQKQL